MSKYSELCQAPLDGERDQKEMLVIANSLYLRRCLGRHLYEGDTCVQCMSISPTEICVLERIRSKYLDISKFQVAAFREELGRFEVVE